MTVTYYLNYLKYVYVYFYTSKVSPLVLSNTTGKSN